jgi:hypothetical protein
MYIAMPPCLDYCITMARSLEIQQYCNVDEPFLPNGRTGGKNKKHQMNMSLAHVTSCHSLINIHQKHNYRLC